MGVAAERVSAALAPWAWSDTAYAAAAIELYSRLWDELEKLHDTAHCPGAAAGDGTRPLALPLELHLLAQTCDSSR